MKVSSLTWLILNLNAAIDTGKYASVSIDDVHAAIRRRALLKFLQATCGNDIDLSRHFADTYGNFEEFYEEAIAHIYGGYAGNEGRKWGVRKQGLCLVLAWTNELIQRAFRDADLPE